MYNISTFRARHGSDLERLDYNTVEGVKSLYDVTVTGERTKGIWVEGTQVVGDGGKPAKLFILLEDVAEVFA